jgi:putative FmdB family regulatory protein
MPIYEYRCASCGHELEALQKFSDAPLTTCPACHAEQLVKRVSAAGFQLKGTGWYVTDFRSGAKAAAKDAKSNGDAATGEKPKGDGGGKTETKTEAKSEAKGTAGEAKGTAGEATPKSGATPPSS